MRHVHLLIKPSSGMCNLNCKYCFYHDIVEKREQHSYGFMEEDTLEAVLQKGIAYAEKACTIAFQGGEPTLIGLDFYKKVVELWKMLIDKNMNKHDLAEKSGVSSASIAKLSKGANITTDVLLKICVAMNCTLEDIMETVKE